MQIVEEQEPVHPTDLKMAQDFRENFEILWGEIHKVIVGQDEVVKQLLTALFSRGHALIIGVPGLAKTLLVRTLAQALGWKFKRIQFTPDLMPSDITGTEILQTNSSTGERSLRFMQGPLFANLILADEINRTPPKTQAALLEAMQEYTVTAAGKTYALEQPFFVAATQNPIEHEGTYPLPEAQLDRFLFSIHIDYPSREEEIRIVDETTSRDALPVKAVFDKQMIEAFQALVRRTPVSRHVLEYAVSISAASRPNDKTAPDFVKQYVEWGAGPRASQCLVLGAKTLALIEGKPAPSTQDIRAVALPVLRHRIIPNYNATGEGINASDLVARLMKSVREPNYTG